MDTKPKLKTPEQILGDIREALGKMGPNHPQRARLLELARNMSANLAFYRTVYKRMYVLLEEDLDGSKLKGLAQKNSSEMARIFANSEIERIREMSHDQTRK